MKTFIVDWESPGNIVHGKVAVQAENITEAQDKFWEWLRAKPIYQNMWRLNFSIEQGESA